VINIGFAASATWTVGLALIADVVEPDELGSAFGLVFGFNTLGYVVGPMMGGVLAKYSNIDVPFYVCCVLAFGDLLGRFLIKPRHRTSSLSPQSTAKRRILSLLKSPRLSIVSSYIIIASLQASSVEASLVRHLYENFSLSPFGISMFLLSWIIPSIVFSIVGGKLSDSVNRYSMLKSALFLSCGSVILLGVWSLHYRLFLLACCIFGALNSLLSAPTLPEIGHIVNASGDTSYGTAYGVTNICYAIGMLVGPLLGDAIYSVISEASKYGFFYLMLLQALLGLHLLFVHHIWTSAFKTRCR
jgi:predicted MFS family arabinose efflux permease